MTRQQSSDLAKSTTVSIRFPERIYDWLKTRSEKERRSFNAQVLLDLERIMAQDNPAAPVINDIGIVAQSDPGEPQNSA